jgi:glycosyltransferase involved in cell wall biosynthesis
MVSRWLWEEQRRNGGKPGFFGELAQAIMRKGIDLTLLSQAGDSGPAPEMRPFAGLKVHVFSRDGRRPILSPLDKAIKGWSGYRKAATDAAVIRRFVRVHGPFDAVVAQCEEPDGLCCALASMMGAFPPLVTQVHDLRYQFDGDGVHFTRKSSLRFVFRKSARVVANSPLTAEWLHREYGVPENKIGQCRIHLTAPFLELAGQRLTTTAVAEERILFLGALNRKKAPDIFLRAATILAPQLPDWTFALAGPETSDDRGFREELQKLVAHPMLTRRLEWLGRLDPAQVMDQIGRARVVVCPSRIESFSRTTIEALALGRPVVVSKTTGAAHWVQSTGAGSVVPADDPKALAKAILSWTSRPHLPHSAGAVSSQLTASLAADDLLAEVRKATTRSSS